MAEAWKIREAGVGGKRQHQQNGSDRHIIENASSTDGRDQLREHALIAGSKGIGRGDVIGRGQEGDARQKNSEQSNDDGEGELGDFCVRLLECADAVADGLDTGHGGAAAGKGLQQQPDAEYCSRMSQLRWSTTG